MCRTNQLSLCGTDHMCLDFYMIFVYNLNFLKFIKLQFEKPFVTVLATCSYSHVLVWSLADTCTCCPACGEAFDRNGSSEEEVDINGHSIDPQAEDRELKGQLLRKYSGYLGSLKQEFMKKRKKGKLPKEARQQLLDWWSRHYKWPYPSVRTLFISWFQYLCTFLQINSTWDSNNNFVFSFMFLKIMQA